MTQPQPQVTQDLTDLPNGGKHLVLPSGGWVEFANPQALAREGDNYYSGPVGTPATSTQVIQGSIEKSNVSGVTTMADMIRVERAYQQLATLMQQQSDLRTTAVQKLGDINA